MATRAPQGTTRSAPRRARTAAVLVLGPLATGLPPAAVAQQAPYLLGDWDGARSRLAGRGIGLRAEYASELAHNLSGGEREITRHADQWTFGATLDLQKLRGWDGATFSAIMTHRSGNDLGADAGIGNNQLLQEVYGRGQTWHLTELSLEQAFLDGRLTWKTGRLTVGADFASFSCDFQNLTFCGSQPGNIVGDYWINWPTSQWATRLRLETGEKTYLQVGAYQVNPTYIDDDYARENGWQPDFPDGTTGVLVPLEFGWTPMVGGRPGSYKVGAWYDTSGGPDLLLDTARRPVALTGDDPLHRGARHGFYVNFRQQISGETGGGGASVFLNISQADRATAATDRQIALGVQYKGPFGRADDMIGFAVGATHANRRAAEHQRLLNRLDPTGARPVNDGNEYVAELMYAWSPTAWLTVRPNLQYVMKPGGAEESGDALVMGLKSSIAF